MAASPGKAAGDQERVKANFDNAAAEIKEDVSALAAVWKTGKGPISKAEAGLFLWHHCYRGEDSAAEVVGAGVITSCLSTLDNTDSQQSDKSTAAGILLALCDADPKHKELVCKARVGSSTPCQVLHNCLADPETAPRNVVPLLASLAGDPTSLSQLLKVLQPDVPWGIYKAVLEVNSKDHGTAIAVAKLVQAFVMGREQLAEGAAAAGLLQSMLLSMVHHKSPAAVGALASCLQAICEAAPANRNRLGQIPGAVQALVDLLGPPPATIIAWEQEQYKHMLNPAPPPPPQQEQPQQQIANGANPTNEQQAAYQRTQSGMQLNGPKASDARRSLSKARGSYAASKGGLTLSTPRRVTPVDAEAPVLAAGLSKKVTGSMKPARSVHLADEVGGNAAAVQDPALANKRQQVSMIGTEQPGVQARQRRSSKESVKLHSHGGATQPDPKDLPRPTKPLLCKNSTALKWDGPVPETTRSAVASVLAELVLLPDLCAAVNERLAASRLATLLNGVMKQMEESASKSKKSKKGSKLTLTSEAEALLTNICACMKFLVVADNANCYRVAAAGCLPALVQLAAESKKTRLRQSAQGVLSQVCMLSEVQDLVKQAEVPEELWVEVPLKLVDSELRQLMIEFPTSNLQLLDDVTASARF